MKLIHTSPLGALDIPEVYEPVAPGVEFDVPDDIARSLLHQGDLFTLPGSVAELRELASTHGVDVKGLKTRDHVAAAIIAVITAPDPEEGDE